MCWNSLSSHERQRYLHTRCIQVSNVNYAWRLQEGHTAHASREDALSCASEMLDMYADSVQHMLAVPVVKGTKSPMERFAGAEETFTIEGMMQNGWALQSGTSRLIDFRTARATIA